MTGQPPIRYDDVSPAGKALADTAPPPVGVALVAPGERDAGGGRDRRAGQEEGGARTTRAPPFDRGASKAPELCARGELNPHVLSDTRT